MLKRCGSFQSGAELPMQASRTTWLVWLRGRLLHMLRIGILLAILTLLCIQSQRTPMTAAPTEPRFELAQIQHSLPSSTTLGPPTEPDGLVPVRDADGDDIGYAVVTLPQAAGIQGFSGPSNVLLVFDTQDRLQGIEILDSTDNPEYVSLVENDVAFSEQLLGRSWDELRALSDVDAVSGATLTSLAIAEGIAVRVGGPRPSLRFPEPVAVVEVAGFLPAAARLTEDGTQSGLLRALDREGSTVGFVMRTSPAADDLIGYQGPTDVLVVFDPLQQVLGMRIRDSFDHQRYVQYVRDEEYFMTFFNGMALQELRQLDLDAARVEGVSGATMTSLAVAESLVRAAGRIETRTEPPSASDRSPVQWIDAWPTVLLIGIAVGLSFSRWRGLRSIRLVVQIAVIVQLGFLTGNMVSLAVLAGWARSGIPWPTQLAQCLLVGAAFLVPATTKRQVYCHWLCPFGAAQQLVLPSGRRRVAVGSRLARVLSTLPWLLLLAAIVIVSLQLPVSLVDLEPFGAFVLTAATWGTASIAVLGLVASCFVPMAYCRFGCPTGAVLSFIRLHGRSQEVGLRDAAALLCLLLAAMLTFAAS